MFNKKIKLAFVMFLLMFCQQSVQSATTTTTLAVSATVLSTCVVAGGTILFGNYTPTANSDNTGTLTVTCTTGTPYKIGLDAGLASGATVTTRQMQLSGETLNYSLYRDSNRTLNWGQTPGTDTVDVLSATGLPVNHTVYGRIPSGQYVTAGAYADTVTVTVTY